MADTQLTSPESKCPLHSVNSSTQENGPAAVSKSKKKRLRKKKKTEKTAAEKGEEEVGGTSVDALQIRLETASAKLPSQPDRKSNQSVPILEKGRANVNTLSSPEKPDSVESSSVQVKCSNKSEGNRVQRNSETVKQSAIDSGPVTGAFVSGACSKTEVHRTKMDSKPPRDDIVAQREAKKLAKLAKKNKSGGDSLASSVKDAGANEPTKENISNTLNANTPKPQKTSSAPVKPPVVGETASNARSVKSTIEAARGTTTGDNQPTDFSKAPSQLSAEPGKTEKRREEIIAEREAKKQAKLAAKNKKKDPGQSADPAEAVHQKKEDGTPKAGIPGDAMNRISASYKPDNCKENEDSATAGEKSKAQLRAERRAKQEAQRAAKDATKKVTDKTQPPSAAPSTKPEAPKEKLSSLKASSKPAVISAKPAKSVSYQPKLLSHLQMDSRPLPSHIYQNVHPAIVELGAKYAARVVSGSNARCIALLQALKKVIADFITPREKEFSRAMESRLNDSMAVLNASRQSSVSMTNALKHVKSHLTQLTTEKATTDEEARRKLIEVIDTFIKEQIDVAGEAICNSIAKKISNGDTIAIYGCSSLLLRILVESRSEGKDFEVVVVDGGPLYEGREMCRRLVAENIRCSYVLLPAFSYVVGQTTKVLLGAHALLANGCVMSRSGTALVAMLAKAHNVPVIVCCETYKFCERVQADAFVHNELGPQNGSGSPPLISLMYDMTPPTLVDAVATELAILPCTSVPVILRVKPSDVSSYYY